MSRRFRAESFFLKDTSFDPWVYKFSLGTIVLALVGNCVSLLFSLRSYPGQLFPYAGTPSAIVFLACAVFVLWRHPNFLRPVVAIIFVVLTLKIGFELTRALFIDKALLNNHLLWLSGFMSIDYSIPFLILRSRVARIVALTTLGFWVALTGIYVSIHWGTESMREMVVVLSQLYANQGILIVFMGLFVRLRGLYLHSESSASYMERLAYTDGLLGTPNRRALQVQLKNRVESATNTPFSVVLIDIDHFKEINDQHGHDIGDEVLVEVASLISQYTGSLYDFGRWGGEEFLVILPNCSAMDAYMVTERIRGCIERYGFSVGRVTASFGVAEFQEGDSLNTLLRKADDALYKSKKLGRNRVEIGALEH